MAVWTIARSFTYCQGFTIRVKTNHIQQKMTRGTWSVDPLAYIFFISSNNNPTQIRSPKNSKMPHRRLQNTYLRLGPLTRCFYFFCWEAHQLISTFSEINLSDFLSKNSEIHQNLMYLIHLVKNIHISAGSVSSGYTTRNLKETFMVPRNWQCILEDFKTMDIPVKSLLESMLNDFWTV